MKITTIAARGAQEDRLFLRLGNPVEHFAVLSVSHDRHKIQGYIGTMTGGAIPMVRPVTLTHEGINPESDTAFATWMVLHGAGLEFRKKGLEREAPTRSQQADIWADFLDDKPRGSGRKSSGGDEKLPIIEESVTEQLEQHGMIHSPGPGRYTAKRSLGFRRGAAVSGFTALKIHETMLKVFPDFPKLANLDVEKAKTCLSSVARPSNRAVAFYGTRDADLSKLRQQAAQSYPVLAGLIAETSDIAGRVDRMEAIQEPLTERTGLSKGSLKRLGKLRAPLPDGPLFEPGSAVRGEDALGVNRLRRMSVSGEVSLDACLRQLASMPADRTPQTDEDWLAFHMTLSGCAIPVMHALSIPESQTLEASKGNWKAFREQLARSADIDPATFGRQSMGLSTIDALEAIEDFGRTVLLPQVLRSIEETGQAIPPITPEYTQAAFAAAAEIVLGKTKNAAGTLLELGRRYASRIPALMDIDLGDVTNEIHPHLRWSKYGPESFPRLAGRFVASNGIAIVPLDNFTDMRRESARLHHCVGRYYTEKARKGNCHMFSVQSADGSESYSDIELAPIPDAGSTITVASGLTIVQHRGMNNRNPSADDLAATREWLHAMMAGRIELNITEIREWRGYLKEIGEAGMATARPQVTWASALGTDWTDDGKAQRHWAEWQHIVRGQIEKAEHPGALYRFAPARELLAEMNPKAAVILTERAREAARKPEVVTEEPEVADPAP